MKLLRVLVCGLLLVACSAPARTVSAQTTLRLNMATAPGAGSVGTNVAVTGAQWPAGIAAADITVHIGDTCFSEEAQASANTFTILGGSTGRVTFTIPNVTSGQKYVWVTSDYGGGVASGNCSSLQVS